MDTIVNFILNRSKVTVEHIKISKATPDAMVMSLLNRVTDTGPMGATLAEMDVDMVYKGEAWGKLSLPVVQTASGGADIVVTEQLVKITNLDAFKAFVKALMLDEELVLTLDNGDCLITAKLMGWPLKSRVKYRKDLVIKGMQGPKLKLAGTTSATNTMKVVNPSPVEILHGVSMFDIVDDKGEVLAELKDEMTILRGTFDSRMAIFFKGKGVTPGTKVHLIGKGTETDAWTNETLKFINQEFEVNEQFASQCSSI